MKKIISLVSILVLITFCSFSLNNHSIAKSLNGSHSETDKCSVCNGSGSCDKCSGVGDFECSHCTGTGKEPETIGGLYPRPNPKAGQKCEACNGKGKRRCSDCNGSGKCSKCKGTGKTGNRK